MTPLFKKLNFKDQTVCFILNAPESFNIDLEQIRPFTTIQTNLNSLDSVSFALLFLTQQAEIEKTLNAVAPKLIDDAVLWFCYPKKSSKKYSSDINRDSGWESLGEHQFEPVRMVAIDEDWSALRFRKVNLIKKITRNESMLLSEAGKRRKVKSPNG
ncbi:MAG: hypothetical protein GW823_00895 [Bacteroidetes bacterium]|nr:hypothetical protein [Bacteroidota bacterium]